MKINGGKGPTKVDLYIKEMAGRKSKSGAAETPAKTEVKDEVLISQAGADIAKAKEVIEEVPEVRIEKVREVKKQIDEGTYRVDGKKVAEKLLKENIINELL